MKCPRCRSSVFPNLDLNALPTIPADPVATTRYMRSENVSSQSYFLRMQGFLRPVRMGNAGPVSDSALETAENGGH